MNNKPLHGCTVLVTRAASQASELIGAIEKHGGKTISFPTIEIVPRDKKSLATALSELTPPDITVFVSPNAAKFGLDYTENTQIVVIGPSTAAAIRAAGQRVDIEPDGGYDSESLLEHPALANIAGKSIRIVRGDGGRELLAETLTERGAVVEYLSVYQRRLPAISNASQMAIESAWRNGGISVITIMSVATLENLIDLLPDWCSGRLDSMPLVTPAKRVIKEILNRYPGATPALAPGPSADDMLEAILSLHRKDSE